MWISVRGDRMKINQKLVIASLSLIVSAIPVSAKQANSHSSAKSQGIAQTAKPLDDNQRAESYYDFTMGHYYQQEY